MAQIVAKITRVEELPGPVVSHVHTIHVDGVARGKGDFPGLGAAFADVQTKALALVPAGHEIGRVDITIQTRDSSI